MATGRTAGSGQSLLEQGRAIGMVWRIEPDGRLLLSRYNTRAVEATDRGCPTWVDQALADIYPHQPALRGVLRDAVTHRRARQPAMSVRFARAALARRFQINAFRIDEELFLFATERDSDRERVEVLERMLVSQAGALGDGAMDQLVASISPVGYARVDATGAVVWATQRWCELHGLDREGLGCEFLGLARPGDRPALAALMQPGGPVHSTYRTRRDPQRPLRAQVVSDPRPSHQGWLVVVHDITAWEAEQPAGPAMHDADPPGATEDVHQLALGVAHDFNNLLSAMTSVLVPLLEDGGLSDSTREALTRMVGLTHRGAVLVDGLLAVGGHPDGPGEVDRPSSSRLVERSTGHARAEAAGSRSTDAPVESSRSGGDEPASLHLLLVEDDSIIRVALARALAARGYRVQVAADGEEGLAKARAMDEVAVVVTDVAMPRLDGIEMVKELRIDRPDLPVLFLSGHARPHDQEATLRQPGIRWLAKPARASQVVQAVASLLARQ